MSSASELITNAVERVRGEVPAFSNLRIVLALELTAGGLTGPAKSENFRVELPGPKVTGGQAADARIRLSIPKAMFGVLAEEGGIADFKDAFYYGHLKVEGDERVKRLLGRAIDAA